MGQLQIIRRYGDTDFVTALRALAATMVVIIHAGAFKDLGRLGENITHAGQYGVQMFFVISGFSIATTLCGSVDYRKYLVRRLFRIVPLYWLVTILVAWLTLQGMLTPNHWSDYFGTSIDAYNLFMHLTFLSCFDHHIGTTIIGVEWTIPVEVFWYLMLPSVILWMTKNDRQGLALLLSVAVLGITQLTSRAINLDSPGLFAKWFPTSHGPYFIMGVIAFQLRENANHWLHKNGRKILGAAWCFSALCLCFDAPAMGVTAALLCTLTIGLFRPNDTKTFTKVATWGPFLFIGSISYSLYLVHFPVIRLLKQHFGLVEGVTLFSYCFAISVVLSAVLYVGIERPMNDLGKRVCNRLKSPAKNRVSL